MSLFALPPVSLRQLQYIVAVADSGGFRRAAEICHVAQPSLSAQVALVERALGVSLFERNRRGVRVSAAGAVVLAQARSVLIAADDLLETARQAADPFRGTLRLGVIPTISPYLLPEIAPALAAAFPDLAIVWREERTAHLVADISQGAIDAAVLALEADLGDLDHVELGRDPFVLAAHPGHPLVASAAPATPDRLEGAEVFLLDDGHCLREQALGLCTRAGAQEAGFRGTSLSTLVQMVSASAGVTLLPSIAVAVENRRSQLAIRSFAQPGPGRTISRAWRRNSALAATLGRLADVMRKAAGLEPVRVRRPERELQRRQAHRRRRAARR